MLSLPELVLKVKVDDSGAKTGLKGIENQANQATTSTGGKFSRLGDIIKGVLAADIVKKFAAAMVDLGKQTLKNVAEFEQLQGGMEKIFDQANQAQILEDANNAWKDLNMSANDYLSSINQVGASFAQTMGDQKGYDVAREGMKAIADYSSGTGRNLEELNEKYKMITRATSSYQSIADQFSGLLPATSKDFLAQAQAAGFLSDEYTKLTDVPVAEYQQAVTQMLTKGTKDMGLYGQTAHETEKTMSGSINGMKSAWQNLLTSFGSGDQKQVQKAMKDFVKSLGYVVKNVGPAMLRIGKSIANLLYTSIRDGIKTGKFVNIADALITKISDAVTALGAKLPTLIPKLFEWATKTIQGFLGKVQDFIDGNSKGGDFYNKIIQAARNLLSGLATGLIKAIPIVLKALPKILLAILKVMLTWPIKLIKMGIQLLKALVGGLIDGVKNAFPNFIKAIAQAWENVKAKIKEKIEAIKAVWNAVKFAAKSAVVSLKDKLTAAKDKVKKAWDEFKADPKTFLMKALDKASKTIKFVKDLWDEFLGRPSIKTVEMNEIHRTSNLIENIAKSSAHNTKRHRAGIDFIPRDEYPALLHYGEAVLSRSEANAWRKQQAMAGRAAASRAAEQPIIVNTDLYVDGRKIASTTAPYMKKAIDRIGTADNRQLGLV